LFDRNKSKSCRPDSLQILPTIFSIPWRAAEGRGPNPGGVQNVSDWDLWLAVESERFRNIQSANTLAQSGIIGDEYLVEMDAEAVLS